MDKLDILTWIISGGFILILGSLKFIWSEMKELRNEIKEVRNNVMDLDRRLCRMEGSMSAKDCCVLKEEPKRKAE